jgi:cell division protein FtsB
MNPTEAKFEAQEAHNKNVALEQTNKELLDRNKAMEEEIKRLLNQVDHLSKEL